ncbi:glycosyltransferase family 2 protein [Pedobacter sp. BS3]|uniref:glycosyltransferase family 2 protein n=1 Tax=Pedobacter sp. BS3 TaxID=2567937 RepID=UPI0011F08869|nr:glycosyltransferase family 2 protein [Pedobacter sp. BS3]TZF83828.1 glycosyltransferase family 2 protein [Pedobacter sp. BS3]
MSYPKVAVIILNWNGQKFLEQFLPSVYNSSYPNLEIILGDNASTDDSVAFTKQVFPRITILQNDKNYGYAGGYNHIIDRVEADYYVLLNSDVEVTENWIEPVIAMMEADPTIAVTQPKLRSYYQRNQFEYAGAAGGYIDRYGYPFCRGRIFDTIETDTGQYDDKAEIFWASGAALFIRSSCWKEVKGLDAGFFAHMEEIDLCWRLKNRGYKVMYCPDSVVYHVGAGTLNSDSPHKTYLNFRNNLAMLKKNLPAGQAFVIIFIRFWLDFLSLLRFVFQGKFGCARAISKAHIHFLGNLGKHSSKEEKDKSRFNNAGFYRGSIVWQYFINKKHTFRGLFF